MSTTPTTSERVTLYRKRRNSVSSSTNSTPLRTVRINNNNRSNNNNNNSHNNNNRDNIENENFVIPEKNKLLLKSNNNNNSKQKIIKKNSFSYPSKVVDSPIPAESKTQQQQQVRSPSLFQITEIDDDFDDDFDEFDDDETHHHHQEHEEQKAEEKEEEKVPEQQNYFFKLFKHIVEVTEHESSCHYNLQDSWFTSFLSLQHSATKCLAAAKEQQFQQKLQKQQQSNLHSTFEQWKSEFEEKQKQNKQKQEKKLKLSYQQEFRSVLQRLLKHSGADDDWGFFIEDNIDDDDKTSPQKLFGDYESAISASITELRAAAVLNLSSSVNHQEEEKETTKVSTVETATSPLLQQEEEKSPMNNKNNNANLMMSPHRIFALSTQQHQDSENINSIQQSLALAAATATAEVSTVKFRNVVLKEKTCRLQNQLLMSLQSLSKFWTLRSFFDSWKRKVAAEVATAENEKKTITPKSKSQEYVPISRRLLGDI